MASTMQFDIFARDHASRVFDKVGDNAERLGRRIDGAGKSTGGLSAHLRGLTGAAAGIGRTFGSLAADMAGMAVKAVAVTGALATLAGGAGAAATATLGLAAALAPVGGLLAALPGVALSAAAAFSVWKLATGGLGEAMGAALSGNVEALAAALDKLSPAGRAFITEFETIIPLLKGFKAAAQDAFLSQISGRLREWAWAAGALKPAIADLASEMGGLVRSALDFATAPRSIEQLGTVLSNTHELVGAIHVALQPLLKGFLDLGTVGSSWLAGLSGGLTDNLTRFGEWMSRIAESGQAWAWMDNALAVLKQLGHLAKDVWGILAGLLNAAEQAGGSALGVLGNLVSGFNEWVNSTRGQEILVTIFKALADVGRALLPVVTAVAGGLAMLAPTIAEIATLVGPILTTAVNALAPALAALGPGIIAVFTNLGTAVQALAESGALTTLAEAITAILIALAPLLPALADLLVPVLQILAALVTNVVAPALTTLVGWIQQAVDWIKSGGGLTDNHPLARFGVLLRDTLMPIVQQAGDLIGKVFADIVTWVQNNRSTIEEWGSRLQSIITSAGQIISGAFQFISIAWDHFGGPLLDRISDIFGGILRAIDGAMNAIAGIINVVVGLITGDWDRAWNGVKQTFQGVWDFIVGLLGAVVGALRIQFLTIEKFITDTWTLIWDRVKAIFANTWNTITGWLGEKVNEIRNFIGRLAELPGQVSAWFGQVRQSIVDRFGEAVSFVRGIPGQILNALGNLGSLLYNSGRSMIQGLIDGLYSMLQGAYNAAADILNRIRSLFPFSPAKEGPFSGRGWTLFSGQSMAEGLAKGMRKGQGMVASAAEGLIGAASVSLAPSVAVGGAAMAPIAPQAGVTINLTFAGQPLISRDEITRVVVAALNEARGRGFNLGFAS